MARIATPGRYAAPRDAGTSGKQRNASGASSRDTEGWVFFSAGRVARCLKWDTLRDSSLLTGGKIHPGQMILRSQIVL